MNYILQKRAWLAGASLLAIVLGSGDANAVVFAGPEGAQYVIPSTGYYEFKVAGADGGNNGEGPGGDGAVVGGELFFDAGDLLALIVGGNGVGSLGNGSGGGGGSFVFRGSSYLRGGLLFAAGGGGGTLAFGGGGAPGYGQGGHPAGPASYGGAGGAACLLVALSPHLSSSLRADRFPTAARGGPMPFPSRGQQEALAGAAGAVMTRGAAAVALQVASTAVEAAEAAIRT